MRDTKWMVYSKRADFGAISACFSVSPMLARILINRGIAEDDIATYLDGTVDSVPSGDLLPDMARSVEILAEKIRARKLIRIIGDYDIDGVCSTYILLQGMRALGEDGEELLPPAHAVIDPKREGSQYPFSSICGAVVAWKLIEELYLHFGKPKEDARVLLPFAAIATVGDVMPLRKENRIIVREGLKAIGSCENLGLQKLIARCELNPEALTTYHIGFVIGPCLNAGGRLESAKLGLSMLLESDEARAEEAAERLKALNDQRKQMTENGIRAASEEIDALPELPKVLVVYLKDCHESVAGIIAGRLKEKYYRPSFVLTDSQEAGFLKGSGRSIEGYHMFHALEEVAPLLSKFGGHPMAAGLTLPESELGRFREQLNRNALLSEAQLIETQWIDIALPFAYANEDLIAELSRMEPFGQGNVRPCFGQKHVEIRSARVLGKNRNVVKLSLRDEAGTVREAIAFTDGDAFLAEMAESKYFAVIYFPELNEYLGRTSLQLVLKAWKFEC